MEGMTSFAAMAKSASEKEAEQEKIRQYLDLKMAANKCVVCDSKQWVIAAGVYKFVSENGASGTVFDMFSSSLPVICCVCEHCGNVVSFSAQFIRKSVEQLKKG